MRIRTYGLDRDTISFAKRVSSGITKKFASIDLKRIDKFVRGVKKMGLWNNMVCWPMRSIHNAGTGSTVYSLGGLGTYDATLLNSPTWSRDGIIYSVQGQALKSTIGLSSTSSPFSVVLIEKKNAITGDCRNFTLDGQLTAKRNMETAEIGSVQVGRIRTITTATYQILYVGSFYSCAMIVTSPTTGVIYSDNSSTNTSGSNWDTAGNPSYYYVFDCNITSGTDYYVGALHCAFSNVALSSTQVRTFQLLCRNTLGVGLYPSNI